MPDGVAQKLRHEIGHVLFIDIVGYSKLDITEQSAQLQKLKEIVRGTEQFRSAEAEGKLLRLPTGDGGALVFRTSPEAPVECAIQTHRALQLPPGSKEKPQLRLRMGIHSGPVNEVSDLNEQLNMAGAGINFAQRVMDCGDAGHILLSKHVADDIDDYPEWHSHLHDLGECEVKHGVRVHLFNLCGDDFGNPAVPAKVQSAARLAKGSRSPWLVAATIVALGIIAAVLFFSRRSPAPRQDASAARTEAAKAAPEKSIAVLPFVNMSNDKEQESFSDGISEELLNVLAKVPQLQVAARTSSFSFKGKPIEIPEIARKLHVANVLEGSVRKSGDQLRITAQLIRAAEGYHLWSETYDRKLDDIFKIQDEIAGEVVKQLKVTLLGAAPTVRQTDPKAYTLYLQARQLGGHNTPEAYTQSDSLLKQVLEIDPRYPPAWAALARNFINKAGTGLMPSSEGYTRAREAEEKALAIDPNYAPAHAGLGRIAMYSNNDFVSSAKHYERALALDPNDLNVLGNVAVFLFTLGRLQEALALEEAVVRRDPVNVTVLYNLGIDQRYTGQFDAAIATLRSVLSLSPGRGGAHFSICEAMLLKGDAPAALAEVEQEKSEVQRLIGLPMVYHALGRKTDSDAALATLIAKFEKEAPYNIAYVYAFRGEADKAFEWLDKAVQYQDPGLSEILVENLFDSIHSDPRWLPFLRKIGKAPEQLAKIQFSLPPAAAAALNR